jgi:hypothetical protein
MKKTFLLSMFFCKSLGVGWLCASTADEYWISFGGQPTEDFPR